MMGVSERALLERPLIWGHGLAEIADFEVALPTGMVTFLLSDIEGSTRLWESAPEAMRSAVPAHYEILADAVGRHGGVRPVEQGEGDSIVAAFGRASAAVAAALEAQRRLLAQAWPGDIALRVRIALHTAEAQLRDEGNYFGVALSRCARVRAIAHGGQTLLTGTSHDLVVDALPEDASLVDLGVHRLRDLGRPEHVYALAHPELPADLPPPVSLDALPHNLPYQLTTFIGREAELEQVGEALAGTRLLTLIGAGGCGKTRLALQLSADALERYPDGAWLVELAPLAEAERVPAALVAALALRPPAGVPDVDAAITHLADARALVVLDNCEHVLEASGALVEAILRACPDVDVLATSRAPLGVPGETDWRVPSLSLPRVLEREPVEAVAQSDAVRLFIERAAKVRPNFTVGAANAPAIAQICHALDGIPLAIELAAARVRVMAVEDVAGRLDDRFRLLTGGARSVVPRQQTLRASVDWSHELLGAEERTLFRRLAVFQGGFTLDAAETVCCGDGLDRYAVLDLLTSLVDKSLVALNEADHGTRYGLLETVRQYAHDRLEEAGERDAARDRHRDALGELAERLAPDTVSARQPHALALLDAAAATLAAALDHALATDPGGALRIAGALTFYWKTRVRYAEAEQAFEAALDAAGEGPPELRCRVLWSQAYIRYSATDFPGVAATARAALELARECGDASTAARALGSLGGVQMWPDPAGAVATLEQARALAREAGDDWALANAGIYLAGANNNGGHHARAAEILAEVEPLVERLGHGDLVAYHFYQRGYMHMLRSELPEFRAANQRSLETAMKVDDVAGEGVARNMAAYIDILEGDYENAVALLEPMLERIVERRAGFAIPYVVLWLSWAEIELGDPARAAARLETIIETGSDGGFTLSFALGLQAEAYRLGGDRSAAAARIEEGLAVARRVE